MLLLSAHYYLHRIQNLLLLEIIEPFCGNYKDRGYTANICVATAGELRPNEAYDMVQIVC